MRRQVAALLLIGGGAGLSEGVLAAADLKTSPIVYKSGSWSVLRSVDTMTDEVSCTGIYKDDRSIRLTRDALHITVQGGIESITLRFGEEPPEKARLASDTERRTRAISIAEKDFSRLLDYPRLRVQVITLVRGTANFDIDLAGVDGAVQNILDDCPIPRQDAEPGEGGINLGMCSERVVARLKERGVDFDDIAFACSSR